MDNTITDKDGTEGVELTMPFYGRAKVFISRPWSGSCQWTAGYVCFTFSAGNQSQMNGCCDCQPNTSCFSQLSWTKTFSNLPMGSPVTLNVKQCYQGSWREVPVFAVQSSPPTIYKLWGNVNGNDPCEFGSITFSEQQPPGNCPNAGGNYCDSTGWVQVPDIELVPYSGYASAYINYRCNEDEDRYAFFSRYPSNPSKLYGLTSYDVIACYNQIGQTWQFNLSQNMKLYYVAALCKDKIDENNMRIIYSIESIDSIDLEDCRLALRSFNGHKKYPYNIGNGGFIIKEALLFHEDGHKEKFEKFMNDYFFLWETEIEIFRRVCASYADIFDARKGGLEMYKKAFEKCYKAFTDAHDKFLGLKGSSRRRQEEERVNNRPEMTELIDLYIKKLKDHCNIQ